MARKKYYIGSVGPLLFDDATPINDPDGDFAGEDCKALVTDGQLYVETPPTDPNHVMRLGDVAGGTSTTFTVMTSIQAGGIGPLGIQYKTRDITTVDGNITAVSAETAWIDI